MPRNRAFTKLAARLVFYKHHDDDECHTIRVFVNVLSFCFLEVRIKSALTLDCPTPHFKSI